MKLTRRIDQGEVIPKWYGVAYEDWLQCQAVCAVVPLNLVIRLGFAIWIFFKYPLRFVQPRTRLAFLEWEVKRLKAKVAVYEDEARARML